MQELELDFLAILRALEADGVRFVLIGGLAMVALGSDHITQDVDIVYARDPENITALVTALTPQHPQLRGAPEGLLFIFDARTFKNMLNDYSDDGCRQPRFAGRGTGCGAIWGTVGACCYY